MLRDYAKFISVVSLAGFIYLELAIYLVEYGFGIAPGYEWMQTTFGRLAGSRIWAHLVHAFALLVAAIPSAGILLIAFRPRAIASAAVTGALTAVAAFLPSLLHANSVSYLNNTSLVHIGVDSLKMMLILMLLTWLLTRLLSNNATQRSALIITPLAEQTRLFARELVVHATGHRPRLKGLDEMPRPRRTLRQHYFAVRAGLHDSKLPGWMWACLVLAIFLSILWGIARVMGLPIEQWLRAWLSL
jgi:hypothetical protein